MKLKIMKRMMKMLVAKMKKKKRLKKKKKMKMKIKKWMQAKQHKLRNCK
jgi:hypothetical protein